MRHRSASGYGEQNVEAVAQNSFHLEPTARRARAGEPPQVRRARATAQAWRPIDPCKWDRQVPAPSGPCAAPTTSACPSGGRQSLHRQRGPPCPGRRPVRRRGNLRDAAQPLGEFRVGPADVPRPRVTAHGLVDQTESRFNAAARPGPRSSSESWWRRERPMRSAPEEPLFAACRRTPSRRRTVRAPTHDADLMRETGVRTTERGSRVLKKRETTNPLRRPRCPWADLSFAASQFEEAQTALRQHLHSPRSRNLKSTPITRATQQVCSCHCPAAWNKPKEAAMWRQKVALR